MDSNRKQRGFIEGKLASPFYKTSKSVPTTSYLTKGTPTVHPDHLAPHQQKHELPSVTHAGKGVESTLVHYDELFGTPGDEEIDVKADKYISTARERFKLDQVNSGGIACEDIE